VASYPMPPWLRPADPAPLLLESVRTGAAIQQAQQRMALSQREADQRFGLEQQRMGMEAQREQQRMLQDQARLQVAQQYHEQQLGLQQQKLQAAKEYNDQRIGQIAQVAGMRRQAQAELDRINAAEDEGVLTPEEANSQRIRVGYSLSAGAGYGPGVAAGIKAATVAKNIEPEFTTDPLTKARIVHNPATGAFQIERDSSGKPQVTVSQAAALLRDPPGDLTDADMKALAEIVRGAIPQSARAAVPPPSRPAAAAPGLWDRIKNVWSPNSLMGAYNAKVGQTAPTTTGTAAPSESPPANPYKVGRRYGNLRYKGGDPNDEANWETVGEAPASEKDE
jgi:hypothetical protein